jgi:hypothetical protein
MGEFDYAVYVEVDELVQGEMRQPIRFGILGPAAFFPIMKRRRIFNFAFSVLILHLPSTQTPARENVRQPITDTLKRRTASLHL